MSNLTAWTQSLQNLVPAIYADPHPTDVFLHFLQNNSADTMAAKVEQFLQDSHHKQAHLMQEYLGRLKVLLSTFAELLMNPNISCNPVAIARYAVTLTDIRECVECGTHYVEKENFTMKCPSSKNAMARHMTPKEKQSISSGKGFPPRAFGNILSDAPIPEITSMRIPYEENPLEVLLYFLRNVPHPSQLYEQSKLGIERFRKDDPLLQSRFCEDLHTLEMIFPKALHRSILAAGQIGDIWNQKCQKCQKTFSEKNNSLWACHNPSAIIGARIGRHESYPDSIVNKIFLWHINRRVNDNTSRSSYSPTQTDRKL